jgi:hypothetical protein
MFPIFTATDFHWFSDGVLRRRLQVRPSPPYDVKLAIGIPHDPPNPQVMFDGDAAFFTDGAYWFVAEKLVEFGVQHIPLKFFDCYGGCRLSGLGLDELEWFANTLAGVLNGYPERWEVNAQVFGQPAFVEREALLREVARLRAVLRRAREEGRPVASLGD